LILQLQVQLMKEMTHETLFSDISSTPGTLPAISLMRCTSIAAVAISLACYQVPDR
jgi:hypothetical protein